MTDLFLDTKSKKDMLRDWILSRNWAKTSDVIFWGAKHYSNRAMRDAQQLCQDGIIKRMSDSDKKFIFGEIKEDVWTKA